MRNLVLVVLLAAGAAHASQTAKQGEDWVRIFDSPCVSAQTMAMIPAAMRSQFKKLQARFQGQTYFGCYVVRNGAVYAIYDDGDKGIIPLEAFKDDLEV